MNMTQQELKAVILLLESTLGDMSPNQADKVVLGVIALLNSKLLCSN